MIKAVIFDIGGVFSTTILERMASDLAKKHGFNPGEMIRCIHSRWPDYKLGRIGSSEFWQAFIESSGIGETAEFLEKLSLSYIEEIPGVAGIPKKLRRKYKTAVLSNNVESWMKKFRQMFDTESMFDLVVSSHEVGMHKPNKDFFDYCLEKLGGLNPEECIFVDDQDNNSRAAKSYGFNVIQFKSAGQLKKELKNMGVEL